MPFTGRGRADDHSNHSKRPAAAVQCSGGLFRPPDGCSFRCRVAVDHVPQEADKRAVAVERDIGAT